MADNIVNARIQLKNDTEAHWNQATNFIPRQGEIIIYSADATHPNPRIKIGDGTTKINNLSFVGLVQSYSNRVSFPQAGNIGNLYMDISTDNLYYCSLNGYKLLNVRYTTASETISKITYWNAGTPTLASVVNNSLTIENGTAPVLTTEDISIITSVSSN